MTVQEGVTYRQVQVVALGCFEGHLQGQTVLTGTAKRHFPPAWSSAGPCAAGSPVLQIPRLAHSLAFVSSPAYQGLPDQVTLCDGST